MKLCFFFTVLAASIASSEAKQNVTCGLPIAFNEKKPCKGKELAWSYDWLTKKCVAFVHKGCHGNRNQFKKRKECAEKCKVEQTKLTTTVKPKKG
ncbi:kunitz-type serine protease inhibitor homolog delta-dendrotoxin-like [Drosophila novamexicana]|uniref:kunitz-type serine protease inhibitor homolog delta-dendrotoxin-like n=1 Tax=Drosophila novamexicana TaxID=47314 RepID=UPI0011E5E5C5|nr:kunitz-type serine protease inhibitor homolog delta-dendrotoxin-like [Drosophila novamexicana]